MKSSRPGSAQWRSSKTMTTGAVAASRSKNVRQAANSCSEPAPLVSIPSRASRAGSIQRRSSGSGHCAATVSASLRARRRLVVALEEAGPRPDHLAERPERDPLAVRRGAPLVPPDRRPRAPSTYLRNSQARRRLADAGRADDRHEPGAPLAAGRVEEVLEQAQLVVATDERGLERLRSVAARRAPRRRAALARRGPARPCP